LAKEAPTVNLMNVTYTYRAPRFGFMPRFLPLYFSRTFD